MADPAPAPNLTPTQGLATDAAGIANLISLLTGKDTANANQVADIADPFRGQRPQYMDQLAAFMKDPSSIFSDPAFTAAQKVGGEAVARNAGAAGMSNSGNKLASLFSFGQASALDFEKQKFNELLPLTGATTGSPAAAAGAVQTGQANQGKTIGGAIAGIASLLTQLGIPKAIADQISQIFGGGPSGVTSGDVSGFDLGSSGGVTSVMDTNAVTGDMSAGDTNIINDMFGSTDQIPDVLSLFGG